MSYLTKALKDAGASPVGVPEITHKHEAREQPSRIGTAPITLHMSVDVRKQLKGIAAEQNRPILDVAGEAFNLVFAKYGWPEIAPVKKPGV